MAIWNHAEHHPKRDAIRTSVIAGLIEATPWPPALQQIATKAAKGRNSEVRMTLLRVYHALGRDAETLAFLARRPDANPPRLVVAVTSNNKTITLPRAVVDGLR